MPEISVAYARAQSQTIASNVLPRTLQVKAAAAAVGVRSGHLRSDGLRAGHGRRETYLPYGVE